MTDLNSSISILLFFCNSCPYGEANPLDIKTVCFVTLSWVLSHVIFKNCFLDDWHLQRIPGESEKLHMLVDFSLQIPDTFWSPTFWGAVTSWLPFPWSLKWVVIREQRKASAANPVLAGTPGLHICHITFGRLLTDVSLLLSFSLYCQWNHSTGFCKLQSHFL